VWGYAGGQGWRDAERRVAAVAAQQRHLVAHGRLQTRIFRFQIFERHIRIHHRIAHGRLHTSVWTVWTPTRCSNVRRLRCNPDFVHHGNLLLDLSRIESAGYTTINSTPGPETRISTRIPLLAAREGPWVRFHHDRFSRIGRLVDSDRRYRDLGDEAEVDDDEVCVDGEDRAKPAPHQLRRPTI
jgi:hypothetical protein